MLAMRILSVPVSLLVVSVQQVYLSEAPHAYREGRLQSFTQRVQINLAKVGALPLIVLGFLAPLVIETIFGTGWERAGWIILWLTPSYVVQFIVSPFSVALHVVDKTAYASILQLVGSILRVGAVALAVIWYPHYLVEFYAISGLLFYVLYYLVVTHALRGEQS